MAISRSFSHSDISSQRKIEILEFSSSLWDIQFSFFFLDRKQLHLFIRVQSLHQSFTILIIRPPSFRRATASNCVPPPRSLRISGAHLCSLWLFLGWLWREPLLLQTQHRSSRSISLHERYHRPNTAHNPLETKYYFCSSSWMSVIRRGVSAVVTAVEASLKAWAILRPITSKASEIKLRRSGNFKTFKTDDPKATLYLLVKKFQIGNCACVTEILSQRVLTFDKF